MSKPIIPHFVDCGFYATCDTTIGKDHSDSAHTEVLICYDETKNEYPNSFQIVCEKGELFISCDGSIEGSAVLSLFESIVEKLRADIEENKTK
jgi:hypothetical protein